VELIPASISNHGESLKWNVPQLGRLSLVILKATVGRELRIWGLRTASGPVEIAPMHLRAMLPAQKIDEGGDGLLVRKQVEIVKRDGGKQHLALGSRVCIAERARLVFESPDRRIELGDDISLMSAQRSAPGKSCKSVLAPPWRSTR
jgi:hypothetical protein